MASPDAAADGGATSPDGGATVADSGATNSSG
jgi:hypothetical protein